MAQTKIDADRQVDFSDLYVAESSLGSAFSITGTNGTFQDTGLSLTLPSAGTYKFTINARAALTGNGGAGTTAWWITIRLFNSTDSSAISLSERLAVLTGVTGQLFQMTCPLVTYVTVAASKNIRLEASRNGNGTPAWTTTNIESNTAGRTTIMAERFR